MSHYCGAGSTYPRWDASVGEAKVAEWPTWALAIAVFLVLIATIWIPLIAITRYRTRTIASNSIIWFII